MLAAAAAQPSSKPRRAVAGAAGAHHYALAALPPAAQPAPATPFNSASGGGAAAAAAAAAQAPGSPRASPAALAGAGALARLAVWDGAGAIICECFAGTDPTRLSIDETIEPRIRRIFLGPEDDGAYSSSGDGWFRSGVTEPRQTRATSGVSIATAFEGADGEIVVRLGAGTKAARQAGGTASAARSAAGSDSGSGEAGEDAESSLTPLEADLLLAVAAATAAVAATAADAAAAAADAEEWGQPPGTLGSNEVPSSPPASGLLSGAAASFSSSFGGGGVALVPAGAVQQQGPATLGQPATLEAGAAKGPSPAAEPPAGLLASCQAQPTAPSREDSLLFSRWQCVQLQQLHRSRAASPEQQRLLPSPPPLRPAAERAMSGARSASPVSMAQEQLPAWDGPSVRLASSCSADGRGSGSARGRGATYAGAHMERQRRAAASAALAEGLRASSAEGRPRPWWQLPVPAAAPLGWHKRGAGRPASSTGDQAGPLGEATEAHSSTLEEALPSPRPVCPTTSFDSARQLLRSLRAAFAGLPRCSAGGSSGEQQQQQGGAAAALQLAPLVTPPPPPPEEGDAGTPGTPPDGAAAINLHAFLGSYSPSSSQGGGAFSPGGASSPTSAPGSPSRWRAAWGGSWAGDDCGPALGSGAATAECTARPAVAHQGSSPAASRPPLGPPLGPALGQLLQAQAHLSPGASRRGLSRLSSSSKAAAVTGAGCADAQADPALVSLTLLQAATQQLTDARCGEPAATPQPSPQQAAAAAAPPLSSERRPLLALALFNRLHRSKSERSPSPRGQAAHACSSPGEAAGGAPWLSGGLADAPLADGAAAAAPAPVQRSRSDPGAGPGGGSPAKGLACFLRDDASLPGSSLPASPAHSMRARDGSGAGQEEAPAPAAAAAAPRAVCSRALARLRAAGPPVQKQAATAQPRPALSRPPPRQPSQRAPSAANTAAAAGEGADAVARSIDGLAASLRHYMLVFHAAASSPAPPCSSPAAAVPVASGVSAHPPPEPAAGAGSSRGVQSRAAQTEQPPSKHPRTRRQLFEAPLEDGRHPGRLHVLHLGHQAAATQGSSLPGGGGSWLDDNSTGSQRDQTEGSASTVGLVPRKAPVQWLAVDATLCRSQQRAAVRERRAGQGLSILVRQSPWGQAQPASEGGSSYSGSPGVPPPVQRWPTAPSSRWSDDSACTAAAEVRLCRLPPARLPAAAARPWRHAGLEALDSSGAGAQRLDASSLPRLLEGFGGFVGRPCAGERAPFGLPRHPVGGFEPPAPAEVTAGQRTARLLQRWQGGGSEAGAPADDERRAFAAGGGVDLVAAGAAPPAVQGAQPAAAQHSAAGEEARQPRLLQPARRAHKPGAGRRSAAAAGPGQRARRPGLAVGRHCVARRPGAKALQRAAKAGAPLAGRQPAPGADEGPCAQQLPPAQQQRQKQPQQQQRGEAACCQPQAARTVICGGARADVAGETSAVHIAAVSVQTDCAQQQGGTVLAGDAGCLCSALTLAATAAATVSLQRRGAEARQPVAAAGAGAAADSDCNGRCAAAPNSRDGSDTAAELSRLILGALADGGGAADPLPPAQQAAPPLAGQPPALSFLSVTDISVPGEWQAEQPSWQPQEAAGAAAPAAVAGPGAPAGAGDEAAGPANGPAGGRRAGRSPPRSGCCFTACPHHMQAESSSSSRGSSGGGGGGSAEGSLRGSRQAAAAAAWCRNTGALQRASISGGDAASPAACGRGPLQPAPDQRAAELLRLQVRAGWPPGRGGTDRGNRAIRASVRSAQ
jgi:hypothetical protein